MFQLKVFQNRRKWDISQAGTDGFGDMFPKYRHGLLLSLFLSFPLPKKLEVHGRKGASWRPPKRRTEAQRNHHRESPLGWGRGCFQNGLSLNAVSIPTRYLPAQNLPRGTSQDNLHLAPPSHLDIMASRLLETQSEYSVFDSLVMFTLARKLQLISKNWQQRSA